MTARSFQNSIDVIVLFSGVGVVRCGGDDDTCFWREVSLSRWLKHRYPERSMLARPPRSDDDVVPFSPYDRWLRFTFVTVMTVWGVSVGRLLFWILNDFTQV